MGRNYRVLIDDYHLERHIKTSHGRFSEQLEQRFVTSMNIIKTSIKNAFIQDKQADIIKTTQMENLPIIKFRIYFTVIFYDF